MPARLFEAGRNPIFALLAFYARDVEGGRGAIQAIMSATSHVQSYASCLAIQRSTYSGFITSGALTRTCPMHEIKYGGPAH